MYLGPVVMFSVQNIWASDCNVLAGVRYRNLVRVVLACRYRIRLARRTYTDYLDHKVTLLVLVVGAIREISVSLV